MSKLKVKQSYSKSFGHSPTFRKIMEKWFWIKPQTKRVTHTTCEHGRVDYKALKVLAVKQANVVEDLGKAILAMEQNRTEEKQELEHIKKERDAKYFEAAERLNYQKATIKDLQKEIESLKDDWKMCDEACDAKQQEIFALRKEVKKYAN